MSRRPILLIAILSLGLLAACDESENRPLGDDCTTDEQCAEGLTCDWGRCREACENATGCSGLPCVPDEEAAGGVCLDRDDFAELCVIGCDAPTICDPVDDRCVAPCDEVFNPCERDETCGADGLCLSSCGDGVVDPAAGEACDDGGDSAECDDDCTPAECGDGHLNAAAGEVCDDGDTNPGDGCSSTCSSDESCGNGIVDAVTSETCDDGGDSAECDSDCSRPSCGDGYLNTTAGEECDDENNTDEGEGGCSSRCLDIACGNGRLDPGEMIDRGADDDDPTHCFVCPFALGTWPDCDRCVYYVDLESATERPDGRSWGSAFHDIQDAVDVASATLPAGAEACDVWVAAGTYRVNIEEEQVVALAPRVRVLGGFTAGALDTNGRGDAATLTILDGDGAQRHVVAYEHDGEDVTGSALLEGFTLRGGFAPMGSSGGGISVSGADSDLVVRRVRIDSNEATAAGGGLSIEGGATAWLENVLFVDNTAATGAAVALDGASSLQIVNATFVDNIASDGPGAIVLLDGESEASAVSSIFDDVGVPAGNEFSSGVEVRRSLLAEGDAGDPLDLNIVAAPFYADAEGGDFTPAEGSPAIDRADGCLAPVTDLLGRSRADDDAAEDLGRGPRADLGALEGAGTPETPDAFFETCCEAAVEFDGRWYRHCAPEDALLPWAQAREACESRDARLASIADVAEDDVVMATLVAAPGPAWVGGHQVPVAESWSWQWADGVTWSYPDGDPDWGWGETCYPPAEDGGLCLALDGSTGDGCPADCVTRSSFVCEQGGDG